LGPVRDVDESSGEEGAMGSKFILAVLAGMVALALWGVLLYGVLFADLFEVNVRYADVVMKHPPDLLWVGLAHLPFGVLLALVVSWRGAPSVRTGASTGAALGLLMAASYDFSQYGTTDLWTLNLTLIEPLISMALVAVAGAVVGGILGSGSSARPDLA
jgi:hypothetical protein